MKTKDEVRMSIRTLMRIISQHYTGDGNDHLDISISNPYQRCEENQSDSDIPEHSQFSFLLETFYSPENKYVIRNDIYKSYKFVITLRYGFDRIY